MAPCYLFLASSSNVELVYTILKGITQFGYLTLCDPHQVKRKLPNLKTEEGPDSTTLTLTKIKIKDSKEWQIESRKLEQNTWTKRTTSVIDFKDNDEQTIVLNTRVTVTFHMIKHFTHLYRKWGIDDFANFY